MRRIAQPNAKAVTTYFVNSISIGTRSIPYSMVTGVQGAPLSTSMGANEIVLNEWAARDLGAKVGDPSHD